MDAYSVPQQPSAFLAKLHTPCTMGIVFGTAQITPHRRMEHVLNVGIFFLIVKYALPKDVLHV